MRGFALLLVGLAYGLWSLFLMAVLVVCALAMAVLVAAAAAVGVLFVALWLVWFAIEIARALHRRHTRERGPL